MAVSLSDINELAKSCEQIPTPSRVCRGHLVAGLVGAALIAGAVAATVFQLYAVAAPLYVFGGTTLFFTAIALFVQRDTVLEVELYKKEVRGLKELATLVDGINFENLQDADDVTRKEYIKTFEDSLDRVNKTLVRARVNDIIKYLKEELTSCKETPLKDKRNIETWQSLSRQRAKILMDVYIEHLQKPREKAS